MGTGDSEDAECGQRRGRAVALELLVLWGGTQLEKSDRGVTGYKGRSHEIMVETQFEIRGR